MNSLSRLDGSFFARWWWSVDRLSFVLIGLLICLGFVLLLAAGPAAASRLPHVTSDFYFSIRQAVFLIPTIFILLSVSMLSPLKARRLGVAVFVLALSLVVYAVLFGPLVNGAHRWVYVGPFSIQPSEFLKTGFVVTAAWMLAEGRRNPAFPGAPVAMGLFFLCAGLLLAQPDYGQAILLTAVWIIMFFIAGWSLLWMIGLAAMGIGAVVLGYFFSPHIARRIDGFVNPASADTYQVDTSLQVVRSGGLFGRGPGERSITHQLPDSHTDFIFAVAAGEFGMIVALLLIALFMAIVLRFFMRASGMKSLFAQCAVCGLSAMIGLQSLINMAVSLRALPAKGMTLPFVSSGGSSLLAAGLSVGLMLALTRTPRAANRRKEVMP